jgi:Bifunctional DNA primase/polymerase, N-terminal/Primase C terminal 2 (PriCT-2)
MLKQNPRLDAALEYVRRWEIFPVPPGLKCGYSVEKRGFDNGKPWGKTTSVKEVCAYWRRLPNANIGIPMGVGSGIFDIECDTVEGHANLAKDGATSLAELEAKHGKLPATLMLESPSGSVHRLYRHPGGDVRIRSGALDKDSYPGIDIKGDGGMSVAPPSRTRKGVYKWINRRRIAAAPQWLLDMVVKPEYAPREPDVWERFANSTRQPSISELTLAVAMIPNPDLPWDPDKTTPGWNAIGMAIFAATDGKPAGLALFDAFSQRSRKYNTTHTRDKWKAFHKCPPREISAGTIFYLAEEAVPDWKSRILSRDPKAIGLLREFHKLLGEPS